MSKKIILIGHPLVAPENQEPFLFFDNKYSITIITPDKWKAGSAGTAYIQKQANRFGIQGKIPVNLTVLPVRFTGSNTWFSWKGLRSCLEKLKPDLIYIWEESWCISCFQCAQLAHEMHIPFIFYAAENKKKYLPWPIRELQKYVFQWSSAAVAITEEAKINLFSMGYTKECSVIPLWSNTYCNTNTITTNRHLVYIGRLIKLKRVAYLIEALSLLTEFQLTVIGDGPDARLLKAKTDKLGLKKRVTFLGRIPHEKIANVIAETSLLILPTDENTQQAEQFGRVVLDALFAGIPALVSQSGYLTKWSADFSTVYNHDLSSPKQIAESIRFLMKNYPTQNQLLQSKEKAISIYSPSAVSQTYSKFFEKYLHA